MLKRSLPAVAVSAWTLLFLRTGAAYAADDPALGSSPGARPLSPSEALAAFRLPLGFHIELVASEPMVMDPVAIAHDEDGRLYVAEMADYPFGPPQGRIKRLVDTNGDGRMDEVTVFAADVPTPMGLLPWRGGLLVAAAPNILFLKDDDGDGKSDRREIVLTGFSEGNQQHRVNGLQWGLDNWIYGANGDAGGLIRRPQAAAASSLSIRGTDFRFRPDSAEVQQVAGQSQFANAFDAFGRRFINSNSQHIVFPVLPLNYLSRNRFLTVGTVVDQIPDHGAAGRVFPTSAGEQRFNDPTMAGHFTSACGLAIYQGDAFPPAWRGNAFVAEPVHNLVHRDVLQEQGATFVARRDGTDLDREFLTSTDSWFRPVNLATAPDGNLIVVDFYRPVIEHPQWIPLEVQQRIDLRAGHDRGRLWRVVHDGVAKAPLPQLSHAPVSTWVAALSHPNGWWRMTAQRLLVENKARAAIPALRRLVQRGSFAEARVHALWTLHGLASLKPGDVAAALADNDAAVREQAVRLAEPWLSVPGVLAKRVAERAGDSAARVRFQCALSAGALSAKERVAPLAQVAATDLGDVWIRAALLSSSSGIESKLIERIASQGQASLEVAPGASELIMSLAEQVSRRGQAAEIASWLSAIQTSGGPKNGFADPETPSWRWLAVAALAPALRAASVSAESVVPALKARAHLAAATFAALKDAGRTPQVHVVAVELLAWLSPLNAPDFLLSLIAPQQAPQLQVAAVRALMTWPGEPVTERLLQRWSTLTLPVRRELIAVLLGREERIALLLSKLESGEITPTELLPAQRERLLADKREPLRLRAAKLMTARAVTELDQVAAEIAKRALSLRGDRVRGEGIFMASCSSCHRRHAQGHRLGPSLEGVSTRDPASLLMDIVNPNRALDPAFQMYVVKTKAGQESSGLIAAETPASVTVRRPLSDETVLLRKDIDEIKAWPTSLMPEGFDKNLSDQNFADLLAFLRGG